MSMSRAVRFEEFGPASVLRVVETEEPQAGPGQIRVRVRTAGLNPVDYKQRSGDYGALSLPAGMGRELAGVVDQAGEGCERFAVGDAVFGTVDGGAIAELVVADESTLAAKPDGLSWEVAGGLALAGQTAYDAVASQSITPADTVLVSAAAGGVGLIVSQLVRRTGATVVGTAGPANHDFLASLGIVPVVYGPGLAERVREAAGGPVTAAFDQHGPETIEAAIALGVDRSRINTIATDPAPYGIARVGRGPNNPATLDELARMAVSGELVIPIEASYPLDAVVSAYERLEEGHLRGKIVLTL